MSDQPSEWATDLALTLIRGRANDIDLLGCHVAICTPCLDGAGGECHTPGCLFWMCSAPDIPIRYRAEDSNGHHIALALDAARLDGVKRGLEAAAIADGYALIDADTLTLPPAPGTETS